MTKKTDKGFQLIYGKLSYRRKLIRTLWIASLTFLFFLLPADAKLLGLDRNLLITISFFLSAVQAYYNYYKWKNPKASSTIEDSEL